MSELIVVTSRGVADGRIDGCIGAWWCLCTGLRCACCEWIGVASNEATNIAIVVKYMVFRAMSSAGSCAIEKDMSSLYLSI